jgi:hypothetical protein
MQNGHRTSDVARRRKNRMHGVESASESEGESEGEGEGWQKSDARRSRQDAESKRVRLRVRLRVTICTDLTCGPFPASFSPPLRGFHSPS